VGAATWGSGCELRGEENAVAVSLPHCGTCAEVWKAGTFTSSATPSPLPPLACPSRLAPPPVYWAKRQNHRRRMPAATGSHRPKGGAAVTATLQAPGGVVVG
jgi:hypothetical protein